MSVGAVAWATVTVPITADPIIITARTIDAALAWTTASPVAARAWATVVVSSTGIPGRRTDAGPAGTETWAAIGVVRATRIIARNTGNAGFGSAVADETWATVAMSQAAVAAHNARNACHARGVASLRTAVGVAGARAVVCDTAGAVIAYLATGTARDAGAASRVALSTLAGITGSR